MSWPAQNVKARIGYLKELQQSADKKYRKDQKEEYARDANRIYGLLRETWERGVEEILLNGVIERYSPSVQTNRAKYIADISKNDIDELEKGMSKCSQYLTGHDSPLGESGQLPNPGELLQDIKNIENWVVQIRRRRK